MIEGSFRNEQDILFCTRNQVVPCWNVNTFNISIDVVDCMALQDVPKDSVSKAFELKSD